ncbi:MAG: nucleotidyltransferase domain-containing protein [Bacilli bacterium]|nr:nucleotidyltransferase domain-containing protein [Bacilli bacterium]
MKIINNKINEIVDMLKKLVIGRYSIALAGAHAKGTADEASDIDIYLFVDETKSYQERLDIVKKIADVNRPIYVSKQFDEAPWGGSIDFYYHGTPIEVVVRTFSHIEKRLHECTLGIFEIIPAAWTSNGYYTFIYLSELSFIVPLDDSTNFIAYCKEQVKDYPLLLKKAIIKRFYSRSNIWLNNFHYKSAIQRMDVLFTTPIVLHTVLDMIQVIYALNDKYYMGDKKIQQSLETLNYCPNILIENLQFLLSTGYNVDYLNKQHEILCVIRDNLKNEMNKVMD